MLLPVAVEMVWIAKAPADAEKNKQIAEKIYALGTGMTYQEVCNLVRFIEILKESDNFKTHYLRKEDTRAPRTVEIDPITKRIFIHLKSHNIPEVGRGSHKRVTYSILYDAIDPKLVATAVVKDTPETSAEIELLEKFRSSEGIIKPIHYSKHTKKSGKNLQVIITPLYNKGSLNTFIRNDPNIDIKTKIQIARDILKGSANLNSMGYVNRDNNKGNFFIHKENNAYTCVIGDLGGYTHTFKEAMLRKPLGPGVRSCAPDLQRSLYENKLTEQDLLSQHVYSLGRCLYLLLHQEEATWIENFDLKYQALKRLNRDKSNPDIPKELDLYCEEVNAQTLPRIQQLYQKIQDQTIQPHEQFEYCVLHMLSADPELRKTNAHWVKAFEELSKQASFE